MIYLQHEKVEFARTKKVFEEEYLSLMNKMYDTFKAKGKTRDVGSPLHHRQSPIGMLSIGQAKMRRIESILSLDDWETGQLPRIIEECMDVANYVLYIAALCQMLEKEVVE